MEEEKIVETVKKMEEEKKLAREEKYKWMKKRIKEPEKGFSMVQKKNMRNKSRMVNMYVDMLPRV